MIRIRTIIGDLDRTTISGWEIKSILEISDLLSGFGFPIKYQGNQNGKYPFYKVSDMNLPKNKKYMTLANNYINDKELMLIKGKIRPKGTIIFPKLGAALLTNKRRILSTPSIYDNNVLGVYTKQNSDFLFYIFEMIDFAKIVNEGAVPSISNTLLSKQKIPFPPFPEQQKIAAILSSVDHAIQATKQVIEKAERLKNGLIKQLLKTSLYQSKEQNLNYSIKKYTDNNTQLSMRKRLQHYFKRFGKCHQSFAIYTYGELFNNIQRPYEMEDDKEYQLITIKRRNKGIEIREKLPGKKILVKKQYQVKENDFIISKRQIVHFASGILPKSLCGSLVSGEYLVLIPNEKYLNSRFLEFLQQSSWFNASCWYASQGVDVEKLLFKTDQWFDLPIALPTTEDQLKVSELLDGLTEHMVIHQDQLNRLKLLKKGLMQKLLTGKIRVIV